MKFSLFINKEREEEVIVYAREKSNITDEIERICGDSSEELIGFTGKEAVRLDLTDVFCFITEDNKIFAVTQKEKLQIKQRLYILEEKLPMNFVKINQSCIANINKIERFDSSIGGSLIVKFKNGYKDYVSRRNMKQVKERLGL